MPICKNQTKHYFNKGTGNQATLVLNHFAVFRSTVILGVLCSLLTHTCLKNTEKTGMVHTEECNRVKGSVSQKRNPGGNLMNFPAKDKSTLDKKNYLQTFEQLFLRRIVFAPCYCSQ